MRNDESDYLQLHQRNDNIPRAFMVGLVQTSLKYSNLS
jgi:hypothetical protein